MDSLKSIIRMASDGRPEIAVAVRGTYAGDGRLPITRQDVARFAAWIAARFPHSSGTKFATRELVTDADRAFRAARAGHYGRTEQEMDADRQTVHRWNRGPRRTVTWIPAMPEEEYIEIQ